MRSEYSRPRSPTRGGAIAAWSVGVGYIRQVALTYAARLAAIPVGLAYSVIAARWLGPSDFGILVAIGAAVGTAAQIGTFGLPTAVLKTAAARPGLTPVLLANARIVGAAGGALTLAGLVLFARLLPETLGAVPQHLLLVAGLTLPLNFACAQFQGIALGLQHVRHYNYVETTNRVLLLLSAVVVLIVFDFGIAGMVGASVALAAIQWLQWHALFGGEARRLAPDFGILRGMLGVSLRAHVTILLTFLVLRSDMLLINAMLPPSSVGVYGVAVQGADALILLPALAGLILFPRIASRDRPESAVLTATAARHTVALVVVMAAATAALALWVVPLLFGAPYRGAVVPLWILLPGVVCYAVQTILQNDLAGRDYPAALPVAWAAALALNVTLNVALLPRLGIAAAAASSTAAYALALALTLRHWTRRFPEVPWRDLFVLRSEERRTLAARLRAGIAAPKRGEAAP